MPVGQHFIGYISHQKASRVDVAHPRETGDQKFMEFDKKALAHAVI